MVPRQSIRRITPYFPYSTKIKKEIRTSSGPDGIRVLTDSHRHAQYCSFPPVNPAKFQLPGMPISYGFTLQA
jgi:hypothetical protein